jgi:hypothetical protein
VTMDRETSSNPKIPLWYRLLIHTQRSGGKRGCRLSACACLFFAVARFAIDSNTYGLKKDRKPLGIAIIPQNQRSV